MELKKKFPPFATAGSHLNRLYANKHPIEFQAVLQKAAELVGSPRLRALIDRLYHHQKLLTDFDAKQILSALQCMDPTAELLLPLLTVLSNATAYPSNQLLKREFRLTNRVCIANMAVSSDNMDVMKLALNHIVSPLTNLSINIRKDQIQKFVPVIPHCLNRLLVRGEVNLNALRLLVNLSCCPDMIPYLLGNKSVSGLLRILDTDRDEVLIRAVTWILCTTSAVGALNLTYDRISEHNSDPFHNPSHTLYYSIYGPKGREELETQAKHLTNHSNKNVASKSARLLKTLANVPLFPTAGSHLNRL
ncbi:hypothetical protein CAEBREN_32855 [Caenorhabditis brenneri]|uniref:Armadillo repeat-containing domain-containing protein n=1 Tax=Caenorhabditis brenneri TaxID=135651 RepID=G0NC93_CAEBE|nr:hypothetical protein CAEBREN_32855 [Caenorhabditis brenneri]